MTKPCWNLSPTPFPSAPSPSTRSPGMCTNQIWESSFAFKSPPLEGESTTSRHLLPGASKDGETNPQPSLYFYCETELNQSRSIPIYHRTNVLNSNIKRIQGSSSKFSEIVFRISTTWKSGLDRSVLRTGREYQTMDAIVTDYFHKLPDPPQFPYILLEEQPVGSQEMLTLLADVKDSSLSLAFQINKVSHSHWGFLQYIKSLMRAKDDMLSEQVSKFITDQSAEFFAIESRQELTGIDGASFSLSLASS